MKTSFFSSVLCLTLILGMAASAQAKRAGGDLVSLRAPNVSFTFASQDGEQTYNCTHELVDTVLNDWEVNCRSTINPKDLKNFRVHLLLRAHPKPVAPKLSYELLYWVTDRQMPAGYGGRYVGSSIWFHLEEPSALMALSASQDVEDIYGLTVKIQLK